MATVLSEAEKRKLIEQQRQMAEGYTPSSYIDNRSDVQKQAEGFREYPVKPGDDDGMGAWREIAKRKQELEGTPAKAPEVIDYVGIEKKRLADEAALKETQRRNLLERDAMNQKGPKGLSRSSKGSSFEEYTGRQKRKSLLVPLRLFK